MFVARYLKLIASVIVAAVLMMAVVVPMIYNQSMETIAIENEGAGWARFAYNPSGDYSESFTTDGSNITIGTQTGTASDMIVYATDVFSIIHADSSFYLIAPGDNSADLGASAGVASASGVITVTDSSDNAAYSTDAATWAYVPASDGNFGFFDSVGATIENYPLAAAGSFAGVNTYNSLVSIDAALVIDYTVTDGAVSSINWELETETPDIIQSKSKSFNAVPTPSYTDGDWGFNLTGSDAAIVSYSGAAGNIVIPSTVSDGSATYTVKQLGNGTGEIFDNTAITGSTLTIPDTVTSISTRAFQNCSGFTGSLEIPASVTSLGNYALKGCSGFTGSLEIPASVTYLGNFAFHTCSGFTGSLEIPASVTSIGNSTFQSCSGFTGSLEIPASVTSIGKLAFQGCSGFTGSLEIPASVTSIDNSAFEYCSGFTGSLEIPASVTSIGNNVFAGCDNISSVVIKSSPTIGTNSFNMPAVSEVLNLGSLELAAGSYGLPSNAEIRADIPLMGYVAPVEISELTPREGVLYDVLALLPVMILVGVMMGVVALFLANRRA